LTGGVGAGGDGAGGVAIAADAAAGTWSLILVDGRGATGCGC
jgi:hypothetical protein